MLTGAGVKKSQPKKSLDLAAKLLEAALEKKAVELEKAPEQPFRFMDLPGGTSFVNLVVRDTANKQQKSVT
jgi:hypothetical protein